MLFKRRTRFTRKLLGFNSRGVKWTANNKSPITTTNDTLTHSQTAQHVPPSWVCLFVCRHNIFPLSLSHSLTHFLSTLCCNFLISTRTNFHLYLRNFLQEFSSHKKQQRWKSKKIKFYCLSRISLRFFLSFPRVSVFLSREFVSKRTREVFTSAAVMKKKKKEELRKISWINFSQVCVRSITILAQTHTQHMHMNKEISWNKIKGKLSFWKEISPFLFHLQCD